MKAVVVTEFGTPPAMSVEERTIPKPQAGHSVVRVHAALVNPLSNQVRTGQVDGARPPIILGVDGSGTIEQSDTYTAGTKVAIFGGGQLGVTQDGLQQEWILVEDKRIFELPAFISLDVGAAMMVNYLTAHQAMTRVAKVESGQTVLISGATGAVGQALIQMALAVGVVPIALVSSPEKAGPARDAGARRVVDISREDVTERILELTEQKGADFAFDTVGGNLTGKLASCLRSRGAVISIGFVGGTEATVDLVDIVINEKRILGYDVFLETPDDLATAFRSLTELVAKGTVRPRIDSIFPMGAFEEAYDRLTSRLATGAILLRLSSDPDPHVS